MLNVKINIHVHMSRNDKKFVESSDVLDELRNIVNTSLSKYVTLQHHDILVWYGPKHSKLSNKYYMFDIFLFSSSDAIDYGAAVIEIRAFFNNLQTYQSIVLSNGAEREMKITFNHRLKYHMETYQDVSVSSGGNLRILFGGQSKVNEMLPVMTISNVNWCYRVPFMSLEEADPIGRRAYAIKHTDIKVYQYQYDDEHGDEDDYFLYLCLDLFTNYIDGKEMHSEITKSDMKRTRTYSQDNNDDPKGAVKVSVIVVAVLIGLFLVTTLCKIRYTSQKSVQSGGQDSRPEVGIASDVAMSDDGRPEFEMVYLGSGKDQNDVNTVTGSNRE